MKFWFKVFNYIKSTLSDLTHLKTQILKQIKPQTERKILVISWWWFRWVYALWIMKAMEELKIKKEIDAIFWISIGSVIWAARSSWMPADKIFSYLGSFTKKDFITSDLFFSKKWWFLSNKKIKDLINQLLPEDFSSLEIPFYSGIVDTNKAKFHMFKSGDLRKIVLGSMSIPWIFPPVVRDRYCMIDWWALNNFPTDFAHQLFPRHEMIGIMLNKFKEDQPIKTSLDALRVSLDVVLRSRALDNLKYPDYLFYRDLPTTVTTLSKEKLKITYQLWYDDWIKMFKKTSQIQKKMLIKRFYIPQNK